MNIYVSYTSPFELNLIRKYIGEIKDFITANGDSFVSQIGTALGVAWLPSENFNTYRYRLTYKIDKFVYPRIPWNGHIAYIHPCHSPYYSIIIFKEPDADIISAFTIRRATHDNIKECERYTE